MTCSCCGKQHESEKMARLHCSPDVAVCSACVGYLSDQVVRGPAMTPILPVRDMRAAQDFWTRAGLDVEEHSPEYALVMFNGAMVVHVALFPDLDPDRNAAACYMYVEDPVAWQERWKARGLPVSEVKVEPWGMFEFSVQDPSGNLVRVGRER